MLKTLVKHEVKSTGRVMCAVYGVFVVATVLACIFSFWGRHASDSISEGFWSVPLMFYAITLVILMVVSLIYLCWRFYYTMYSAQGYLTHTLPVKTSWILNCKILVSAGFFLTACVVCMVSIAITGAVATGEGAGVVMDVAKLTVKEGAKTFHMHQAMFVIFILAVVCLAVFNYLLMFFAGSSIGQLSKRSKGAAGIAAGIGLYYASQVVTVILLAVGYVVLRQFTVPERVVLFLTVVLEILWVTVYYLINRVISVRHLNLE